MRSYDFAELPVPTPMQRSWAVLFAARCEPGGGWNALSASLATWRQLQTFARFLATEDHPPIDVSDLTAGLWNRWRLSRSQNASGRDQITRVAAFLQADARVTGALMEAMAKRVPLVKKSETALPPDEFTQVRTTAQRMFRTAHLRITENTELLHKWRAGAVAPDTREHLIGEALDTLARTGNVPRYLGTDGRTRVINRYRVALGGENALHTWRRLFLNRMEAVALAVLLSAEHGFNATTVSKLRVPRATPGSGEDGFPVYRLELEKARRGAGRHFETRNLTDFGSDSPGRLITKALQATAPARQAVAELDPDVDRLLIWRENYPRDRTVPENVWVGMFGIGLHDAAASDWARKTGLPGSPMRRLRKTVNALHRREPGQNSQDTHDSVYVLPEPQVQEAAIPVIAAGINEALDHARNTVLRARLSDRPAPDTLETATTACTDYRNSPFTPVGTGCRASFLLCTACPNARVAPVHHPRLAHLHRSLQSLRDVLAPELWDADWYDAHARLEDLKARLGEAVWQQALAGVTAEDREIIDHLLNGHYDA